MPYTSVLFPGTAATQDLIYYIYSDNYVHIMIFFTIAFLVCIYSYAHV